MNSYKGFVNRECEYYPCHDMEDINCMFCFCPLYPLKNCGGDYTFTAMGVKDCHKCTLPHSTGGYERIVNMLSGDKYIALKEYRDEGWE